MLQAGSTPFTASLAASTMWGLHAMTNYVPKGSKGTPLTKLLRQLRIPYDALDLSPQNRSRIAFPGCDLGL